VQTAKVNTQKGRLLARAWKTQQRATALRLI